ncbi:MAG: glycosyltransferase [Neisseria elongata]
MAGYNTVTEILASQTPALLVPRETPRLEQFIRASGLKKAGAVDLLRVTDLSAAALEDRLSELLGDQEASRHQLTGRRRLCLDGLATVPLLAAELMDHRHDAPTTSPTYLTSHPTSSYGPKVGEIAAYEARLHS